MEALEEEILEENSTMLENICQVRKELLLIKNSVFPLKMLIQNYLNK